MAVKSAANKKIMTKEIESEEKTNEIDIEKIKEQLRAEMEAELKAEIRAEMEAKVEAKKPEVKPIAQEPIPEKTYVDTDYVKCHSVTSGGLNVVGISGNVYRFPDYGAICEINYRDLVTMIHQASEHVFKPTFVIDDASFLVKFPTIQQSYNNMYTNEDLEAILNLPASQMMTEIKKLPDAVRNGMQNKIATWISNGRLDSVQKIRALSEYYNSDFNLLSELFVK